MTTDSLSAGGDPRRLLSDVRSLAARVRRDQRVTWVALLVLAAVTFVAMPFDWFGMEVRCTPDGVADGAVCAVWRRGAMFYWPPALLLAYAGIAVYAVRSARARGLGARVMPFVVTGAGLTLLFTASWVAARLYLYHHVPAHPFPSWVMVLDRLVAPAGTIGVALLVLARLERNLALLVFTVGYLVVVLAPVDLGWGWHWSPRTDFLPQQVINGVVLLLGGIGFAVARRWKR